MSGKARSYCFTLNNYTEDEENAIHGIDCKYLIVGREVGENGTPHLQGYVSFDNPRSFNSVRKLCGGRAHLERANGGPASNREYCSKGNDFFEKGTLPEEPAAQGEKERERWRQAREMAMRGDWENIPDDLYVRYQASFKRMHREDRAKPNDLEQRQTYGVWYHGPPRTGKSHRARTQHQPLYLKDINKWWDDYTGESNVLIDELAPEHAGFMVGFLKRWADRWSFSGETKGGKVVLRPNLIIVTSNYSIDECFANCSDVDRAAIKSRFEEVLMDEVYQI